MMPAILALRRVIVRQAIPFVGVVTPHCPGQVWEGSYAGHRAHGCDPPADDEFTVIKLAARSASAHNVLTHTQSKPVESE